MKEEQPMRAAQIMLSLSFIAAIGCGSSDKKGGAVQFTASGEVLALGGYAFPPPSANSAAFVDGWEIKFDELLVTFDKITLSENPDKSPTDQSQTDHALARGTRP